MADNVEAKKDNQEIRKSNVRIIVTYAATAFLFVIGPMLFMFGEDRASALSVFNMVMPIAVSIISFWFAGRGQGLR